MNIQIRQRNILNKKKGLARTAKRGGFTLVETLVAVTILIIGTLGPIVIAAQGIASAGYAKDQITAYYLAQEGIEFIRNVRDTNAIQGLTDSDSGSPFYWLSGLDSCDGSSGKPGCSIDAKTGEINMCSASSSDCPFMTQDENGYYGYDGSLVTPFKRTIKILPGDSDSVKTIQVQMDWSSHGNSRSFTLSEDIYNSY